MKSRGGAKGRVTSEAVQRFAATSTRASAQLERRTVPAGYVRSAKVERFFEKMTKDEVIEWFTSADDVSPALESMTPATEPVTRPAAGIPMMLASIRLPVTLVEQVDSLADLLGVRRSDVIRDALTAYVRDQTAPVDRDEGPRLGTA